VNYPVLVILISFSALFAYINHRYLKMPFVIGLFFLSTFASLVFMSSRYWSPDFYLQIKDTVTHLPISRFILDIMLGFLLFAGSLHTSWADIRKYIRPITIFALPGVVVSTLIVAGLLSIVCTVFGVVVPFIYCLLFGALISPTDPIAVLGILTKAGVPKKIETIVVGESLFNDGVGVVMFLSLFGTLQSASGDINYAEFGRLFLQEGVGGILFGLGFGFLLHYIIRSINHYETEVLLTIAFVMLGYSICLHFHVSGPLAMVVMGLLVGNYKHEKFLSDISHQYVSKFWELVDMILNAILFILVGLVLVMIEFKMVYILIGILSIIIVLLSRVLVVYLPNLFLPKTIRLSRTEGRLLTWGGLRGGLSIALVLSLPDNEFKDLLLVATYCCVLFSILIQGLTISKLAKQSTDE
jgi:CPA1 family monovalent cation:H+ antiporter